MNQVSRRTLLRGVLSVLGAFILYYGGQSILGQFESKGYGYGGYGEIRYGSVE